MIGLWGNFLEAVQQFFLPMPTLIFLQALRTIELSLTVLTYRRADTVVFGIHCSLDLPEFRFYFTDVSVIAGFTQEFSLERIELVLSNSYPPALRASIVDQLQPLVISDYIVGVYSSNKSHFGFSSAAHGIQCAAIGAIW